MGARLEIRQLRLAGYGPVIAVVDDWWGGRQMAGLLPRLFFERVTGTSFAAERGGALAGFLVGFLLSQARPARRTSTS